MRRRRYKDIPYSLIKLVREKYSEGTMTIDEIGRLIKRTNASVVQILTGVTHKHAGGPIINTSQLVRNKIIYGNKQIVLNIPGDDHDILFDNIQEAASFCVTFKQARNIKCAESNIRTAIKNNSKAYDLMWRLAE